MCDTIYVKVLEAFFCRSSHFRNWGIDGGVIWYLVDGQQGAALHRPAFWRLGLPESCRPKSRPGLQECRPFLSPVQQQDSESRCNHKVSGFAVACCLAGWLSGDGRGVAAAHPPIGGELGQREEQSPLSLLAGSRGAAPRSGAIIRFELVTFQIEVIQ